MRKWGGLGLDYTLTNAIHFSISRTNYPRDGERFASGGADGSVIIWTKKAEGIIKYSHSGFSVQTMAWNPVQDMLASASNKDLGLWNSSKKGVRKCSLSCKALCCDWTSDGYYLALGLSDGSVIICDTDGYEMARIKREAPIWSLNWFPGDNGSDVLAVGSWDQTLSFYSVLGAPCLSESTLEYIPCSLSYLGGNNIPKNSGGGCILVGGSNKRISIFNTEGMFLGDLCGEMGGWALAVKASPNCNFVSVGCHNGSIKVIALKFAPAYSLHEGRFACRENLTGVLVQNAASQQKVTIHCNDFVKDVALYKNRMAILLPCKVHIFEFAEKDDPSNLNFEFSHEINLEKEFTGFSRDETGEFLGIALGHIILCRGSKLNLLDFEGHLVRGWLMESNIKCLKNMGGPPGREAFLLGTEDGKLLQIFVHNLFPLELITLTGIELKSSSITCCDINTERLKAIVVTDSGVLMEYNLDTKEMEFRQAGVTCAAYNVHVDNMFCYCSEGYLFIKMEKFTPFQYELCGILDVIGFSGSVVFVIGVTAMYSNKLKMIAEPPVFSAINVPVTSIVHKFVTSADLDGAYMVACLGATQQDWKMIGLAAENSRNFKMARRAYSRMKDLRYVDLLSRIERERAACIPHGHDDEAGAIKADADADAEAELLAHRGMLLDAAKVWTRSGAADRALDMFVSLKKWEDAKAFASSSEVISTM